MDFRDSIGTITGVGPKTEQLFNKLGVYTVGDILLRFPRAYLTYSAPIMSFYPVDLSQSKNYAFSVQLLRRPLCKKTARMDVTSASFLCDQIPIHAVWFRMNYIAKQLTPGCHYILYGRIKIEQDAIRMEQPTLFMPEKYEMQRLSMQPVYALTKGISQNALKKAIAAALDAGPDGNVEDLPMAVVEREDFASVYDSLRMVHFPLDLTALKKGRDRFVYREFFYFILNSRLQQKKTVGIKNPWKINPSKEVDDVLAALPFTLTKGQSETLGAVRRDLYGEVVSQRLIQGDVGSGKTIVAFLAMLEVIASGYQAAIMAPTEVLAMQHAASFRQMIEEYHLSYQVICLVGSMKASEKREAYERIASEKSAFIVGTHALIQDKVIYHNLALVVTDEQHRFGVRQRESLAEKGMTPHMLVMSATPIPRTLAMILYGNMAVSAIKEVPATRLPIKTCVVGVRMRKKSYEAIRKELFAGHQAYIICPMVESSEESETESVTEYASLIHDEFIGYKIGILHGKMPSDQKNQVMQDFADRKIDILVSTTVVEVGINVPNATIIMIENAERFGLAQLHQLRGRVGRGADQSYCILIDSGLPEKSCERLDVLNQSNDGFFIAQEDLRLRGPGDFFGIRQSGELGFRIADILTDADMLKKAAADADAILAEDPDLAEHTELREHLASFATENHVVL